MKSLILSRGDDNSTSSFTSGTTGKPKVCISHDNLLSFTNWMITDKEFLRACASLEMLAQPPYSLTCLYNDVLPAPTLALGGTLFTPLQVLLRKTLSNSLKLFWACPIAIWTSTPSFADMAMLSDDFNSQRCQDWLCFYFDGEELTVKTAQKLRDRF